MGEMGTRFFDHLLKAKKIAGEDVETEHPDPSPEEFKAEDFDESD